MQKKSIVSVIVAFILGIIGLGSYQTLGGQGTAWLASSENLVGSSTSLSMLASSTVFADSVSAIGTLTGAVDQLVETSKLDHVRLNIAAKGGTVTSSVFVRQMISQDGTNYFDVANASSTLPNYRTGVGTSTIPSAPLAIQWDPGTSTSSLSIPFETYGARYSRFLIWGEDVQADPTDGTYVWIQAIKAEPLTR